MKAIKLFVVATVAGMGLAMGIGIILGWVLLLRSWVHAAAANILNRLLDG